MFVSPEKKNLLGKLSFSLQILLHAPNPIFLLLILYDPGNFPQKMNKNPWTILLEMTSWRSLSYLFCCMCLKSQPPEIPNSWIPNPGALWCNFLAAGRQGGVISVLNWKVKHTKFQISKKWNILMHNLNLEKKAFCMASCSAGKFWTGAKQQTSGFY